MAAIHRGRGITIAAVKNTEHPGHRRAALIVVSGDSGHSERLVSHAEFRSCGIESIINYASIAYYQAHGRKPGRATLRKIRAALESIGAPVPGRPRRKNLEEQK